MLQDLTNIPRTSTAIAEAVTGKIEDFRQVIADNIGKLDSFLPDLPPQVAKGIEIANKLGLDIPSEDVMKQKALSALDKALFGAYRPTSKEALEASGLPGLDKYLDSLEKQGLDLVKDATKGLDGTLKSIDWLLK